MMETRLFTQAAQMSQAAAMIAAGGMVAVPTETVYGLCVNGLNSDAVAALYEIKGRPEVKPLSLMVASPADMKKYAAQVPPAAQTLAARFWPGPLTIVLRAKSLVPSIVRAGGETVGLRCPDHPLTLSLLEQCRLPLAGPSANPSGQPSPKTAPEALAYFDGKIDAVIDGGACGLGRESTVIDMSSTPYRILRQGALSEREIEDALLGGIRRVGLTGGTGSGKTTVLKYLTQRGALGLDCDDIYHQLLKTSQPMLRELRERFPAAFADGILDRKALGAIVFADAEALGDLNAITHRYVRSELEARLRAFAWQGGTVAVIDAIALIESGLAEECDVTVGVTAPAETRLRRIMAREGIGEDYARARMASQKDDGFFAENCDYLLRNDGTLRELEEQCRTLFGQ